MDMSRAGKRLGFLTALCLVLACSGMVWAAQPDPFDSLFGYKAFPAEKDFPRYIERRWTKVLKVEYDKPCLQRDASCLPAPDAAQWLYLARKAPSMDELALLRSINAFFNKFPTASDMSNYGVADHWPTLAEFFSRRSGDCKAYTLAKYFALRALGMDDDKLRIVIAHHAKFKVNHAMLAVAATKGVLILTDLVRPTDLLQPQEKLASEYIPLLMLNEKGRWTFRQAEELLRAKPYPQQ